MTYQVTDKHRKPLAMERATLDGAKMLAWALARTSEPVHIEQRTDLGWRIIETVTASL